MHMYTWGLKPEMRFVKDWLLLVESYALPLDSKRSEPVNLI